MFSLASRNMVGVGNKLQIKRTEHYKKTLVWRTRAIKEKRKIKQNLDGSRRSKDFLLIEHFMKLYSNSLKRELYSRVGVRERTSLGVSSTIASDYEGLSCGCFPHREGFFWLYLSVVTSL